MLRRLALLLTTFWAFNLSLADACPAWGLAQQVGVLDGAMLPEASGFVVSRAYPERLYAVNDSSGPSLVVMSLDGSSPRRVELSGVEGRRLDLEALSVGPCGVAEDSCVFVANSGGNNFRREGVAVYLTPEAALEGNAATPLATLRLEYPDGPHDAEGFAVHPNGDLYVLTKEGPALAGTPAARLYRLRAERWRERPDALHELKHIANLELSEMTPFRFDLFSQLATDFAIAPDGKSALVLTYGDAFELQLDLSSLPDEPLSDLGASAAYRRIPLVRLPQQESLSYLPDGEGFLYGSEARLQDETPLYLVRCE